MDKGWITSTRGSEEYVVGVNMFMDFAFGNAVGDKIMCPCRKCNNCILFNHTNIFEHLILFGFNPSYQAWSYHGEVESMKYSNESREYSKYARIAAKEAIDGKQSSLAAVYFKTRTRKGGAVGINEQTRAEREQLGDDDKLVEEYLMNKNMLRKRPGLVALKGRGVCQRDLKKAKFEQQVHKIVEEKLDVVRAECIAKIDALKDQFSTVINNLLNYSPQTSFNQIWHLSIHFEDVQTLTLHRDPVRTILMF